LPGRDVMGDTTADFAGPEAAGRSPLATNVMKKAYLAVSNAAPASRRAGWAVAADSMMPPPRHTSP